jgi:hypothetical protein
MCRRRALGRKAIAQVEPERAGGLEHATHMPQHLYQVLGVELRHWLLARAALPSTALAAEAPTAEAGPVLGGRGTDPSRGPRDVGRLPVLIQAYAEPIEVPPCGRW